MATNIRAAARLLMPKWVNQGYSALRVTQELTNMFGKAYRRTVLLSDLREAKGVVLNQIPLQRLRATTPIPQNYMVEAVLRRPRRYLINALGEFRDEVTGAITQRHISWYTQTTGTKQELFDEFRDSQLVESSAPGEQLIKVDFLSVRHHTDMSY